MKTNTATPFPHSVPATPTKTPHREGTSTGQEAVPLHPRRRGAGTRPSVWAAFTASNDDGRRPSSDSWVAHAGWGYTRWKRVRRPEVEVLPLLRPLLRPLLSSDLCTPGFEPVELPPAVHLDREGLFEAIAAFMKEAPRARRVARRALRRLPGRIASVFHLFGTARSLSGVARHMGIPLQEAAWRLDEALDHVDEALKAAGLDWAPKMFSQSVNKTDRAATHE